MATKILIVDDERAILFAMREYFAAYGFDVDCARDRQEAETLLIEQSYAVLITDLRLTGSEDTDGLDIVRFALERHTSTRSILLTAYGTPEIERMASALGVSVCLSKPRPLDEILETVVELLEETAACTS
ncbi:MAG: response regulator [Gammaproteobacteria bacterium]|nr:response regulator [Gammaproteobacteria bacterium]